MMVILTCPYCDFTPKRCFNSGAITAQENNYKVICDGCGAEGPTENTSQHAIIRWNKISSAVSAMREITDAVNRQNTPL